MKPSRPSEPGRSPQLARHDPRRLPVGVMRRDLLLAEGPAGLPERLVLGARTACASRWLLGCLDDDPAARSARRHRRFPKPARLLASSGRAGAGPSPSSVGVRENRGAGAGCITPSCSRMVCRAARCGWSAASLSGVTGSTQASEPAKTAAHSAWRPLGEPSGDQLPQRRPLLDVGALGQRLVRVEQPDELVVELRLERSDRHELAIARLVDVVERRAAVEEVVGSPVAPHAGRDQPVQRPSRGDSRRRRSRHRRPGPARMRALRARRPARR